MIPLDRALLCLDCEMVVAAPHDHCPACAGRSLYPLVRWVNPEPTAEQVYLENGLTITRYSK